MDNKPTLTLITGDNSALLSEALKACCGTDQARIDNALKALEPRGRLTLASSSGSPAARDNPAQPSPP